jgi:hypothetical protein
MLQKHLCLIHCRFSYWEDRDVALTCLRWLDLSLGTAQINLGLTELKGELLSLLETHVFEEVGLGGTVDPCVENGARAI